MATTDGTDGATDAGAELAVSLGSAPFVHAVTHADGGALAATAQVCRALVARDTPYQVTVARTADAATERGATADADASVLGVGCAPADAAATLDSLSVAQATAERLADCGDATLTLAGALARGEPTEGIETTARRRPGLATPTADLVDGLAHATLVHGRFSGDTEAAGALLAELDLPAELDESDHRRLASLVAVETASGRDALGRALYPHPIEGPVETAGGYADVLDTVARTAPGTALAFALGHDVRTAALDAWRDAAEGVHDAVRAADPARYSGVVVADVGDAPVWTSARLLRDFRSPEPAALAVGDGEVALAADATTDARRTLADAAGAGAVGGTETLAYARCDDPENVAAEVTG